MMSIQSKLSPFPRQVTNVPQSVDPDGLLLTMAGAERQPYFYRFAVHYPHGMDSRDAEFTVKTHGQ